MYIVSNWNLEQQYADIQWEYQETWNAFLRRIHTVTYFGKNGTIEKYASVQDYFCRRLDALIESTGTDTNAGANTEESSDEESQKAFPPGKKISD